MGDLIVMPRCRRSGEQQRRFFADASHQLKTPVTVLRAGLDELLAREDLTPEFREEISQLIHQTYRLTGVIEDLLLLSRLDAGRHLVAVVAPQVLRGALAYGLLQRGVQLRGNRGCSIEIQWSEIQRVTLSLRQALAPAHHHRRTAVAELKPEPVATTTVAMSANVRTV